LLAICGGQRPFLQGNRSERNSHLSSPSHGRGEGDPTKGKESLCTNSFPNLRGKKLAPTSCPLPRASTQQRKGHSFVYVEKKKKTPIEGREATDAASSSENSGAKGRDQRSWVIIPKRGCRRKKGEYGLKKKNIGKASAEIGRRQRNEKAPSASQ